ncbi:hypothetical protein AVEN_127750-1 [Araneus ventricosus]|uniref:Uncharacterized protein n=1 Tax=Araneus ventricosus TaxID=182803 RepID=A0A4Y2ECI2_ARAVE|nr:hypothetical protein AVEN_127750-1 [Araneus ventricosus]
MPLFHQRKRAYSFPRLPTNALLNARHSGDFETNSALNRFVFRQLLSRGINRVVRRRRFWSYLGAPEELAGINQPSRNSQAFVAELGTCLELGRGMQLFPFLRTLREIEFRPAVESCN